jgi:hypothetical protein
MALGIALLATMTGCAGYVEDEGEYYDDQGYYDQGYYGEGYYDGGGPDIYVFGGRYERGHDVRRFARRGLESRAAAHPGIRGEGHFGGGGGHFGGGHGGEHGGR